MGFIDQALDELVVDAALHIEARIRRTHLALVEEYPEGRLLRRQVQVLTVCKHQVRALASTLQPHLLEVGLRGVLHEVLAHLGRTGKYQAIDVRVQPQCLAGALAHAWHHVQHALGDARLERQLGQAQGGKRRLLSGLEYHAIACRQGGCQFPGGHVQREIPRHHRCNHAQCFAGNGRQRVVGSRRDLIIELVQGFTVPGENMGRAGYVDVIGVHYRLAHVQGVQQCEFFAVGHQQVGEFDQDFFAFAWRHAPPRAVVKGAACGAHCQVDLRCTAGGDLRKDSVSRRVDGVEGRPAECTYGMAVDQGGADEGLASSALLPRV